MPQYRAYLLTGDHKVAESRDMACVDDAEALLRARALKRSFAAVEVWCGDRRVHPADKGSRDKIIT